jgi:conjugative relaxase-like TrwC/TraI family protein
MLTIATITPQQGKWYYKQDNYYSQNKALSNSEWWGKGASALGLSGQIADDESYQNAIDGYSPNRTQPLREKPKNRAAKERAGVDMTFSAPKSVSLACLVGGDKRLEAAHRTAVKRTLALIEGRYAQTRVKGERIKTDNLTVALWHHDTSRELDPHLHTHCILMNATQLRDGKWQSRTDENLYYHKILLGRFYRNELALECQKLGYEIEPHPKELFEIKGYSREQIEGFSKRHEQILDKLAEIGAEPTTENKIWAWRKTRAKKNHEIDRDEMLPYWHEEADLYGIVHPVPSPSPSIPSPEQIQDQLKEAVDAGIAHCSEREVAFSLEAIEKFVVAQTRPFHLTEIERIVTSHQNLFQTFDGRFTTTDAIARELKTIRLMQSGKDRFNKIASQNEIGGYLDGLGLTGGQKKAIALAATTNDQFVAWQGVAGAGKTYALNRLRLIAVERGYEVKGFAPSAEASKVLGEELEIGATTVARLLYSKPLENPPKNQIWIVDEAGLLGAADALALLKRAIQEKARVILVGDTKQLSAVEAGNPFCSLQQAGISTAYLNESRRQKSPDLQKAVNLAQKGEITASLNHLASVGRIVEIADEGERASSIAVDYIALSPTQRDKTLILAGTNAERLGITEQIRLLLKKEGSLGNRVEAIKLVAKDLTQVQSSYTHYYLVGDIVMPTRSYYKQGLEKFQPYFVEKIEKDSLLLRDLCGDRFEVNPMKFRKTVYAQQNLEIAVGDKLRWTRNDKEMGRRNGQAFVVSAIEGHTATITYSSGETDTFNLIEPLHLDYALVSTTYSSQGKTAERVLISASANPTVSQESFYVAISRAKTDLKLYVQDRVDLLERASQSKAKENPLELLRQKLAKQIETESMADIAQDSVLEKEASTNSSSSSSSVPTKKNLSRSNYESTDTEQPRTIDGADIGRRTHQRIETYSRATRPQRRGDRSPRSEKRSSAELKALTDRLRSLPLEEVAQNLELQRHRYDKHKWKSEAHIISINDGKFYDHLASKGGGGAIDLVMHVLECDFQDAIAWLDGRSRYAIFDLNSRPPLQPRPSQKELFKAPACNVKDESKWLDVKQYLTQKRGLPELLVESLHQQGLIAADSRCNAMFFRYGLDENFSRGEAIGASLRGTEGDFKGLTPLTGRDAGYFWFQSGHGEVKRVAIAESPIDAMSLSVLEKPQSEEATVYLSVDGAGAIPEAALRRVIETGGRVVLAHDRDRPGEEMAWRVASTLVRVERIKPAVGKDWNEALILPTDERQNPPSDILQWKRVARALGKSDNYLHRITEVAAQFKAGQSLSEQANKAMQQDFRSYRQIQNDLWQWYWTAQALNKSETYLRRIAEVAQAFNATQPTPLPELAGRAMKQDFEAHRQLQQPSLSPHALWERYSQDIHSDSSVRRSTTVTLRALKDGYGETAIAQMLESDPEVLRLRQHSEIQAQKYVEAIVKGAMARMPQPQFSGSERHISKQHSADLEL